MTFDLTIQEDGSVSLPESLLKHLGVNPGDNLVFETLDDGSVQVKGSSDFTDFLTDLDSNIKKNNSQEISGVSTKETIEDYITKIREKMNNE